MEGPAGSSEPVRAEAVSFPSEELILVDGDDRVVGHRSKQAAHRGAGVRHRAFSVFLFDTQGRLLVHRRSEHKPLWPNYWTNSCCSHPRRGESLEGSVSRRLREELGCTPRHTQHVCRFEYQATYGDAGSEHELCHVFLARNAENDELAVHPLEVAELRWMHGDDVDLMMHERTEQLTPWFRLEWAMLRDAHGDLLGDFLRPGLGPRDHLDVA